MSASERIPRESGLRENRTGRLSGGRRLAPRGASSDPTEQLVDAFIDREYQKLLDKQGKPLLSTKGHRAFMTQLAEEMWWLESRRLDVSTVQAVAEIVTESFGLPPGSSRAIVERVTSYAFLSSSEHGRNMLRFEHEVFYGYFLAHKLRECIEQEPHDLRRFLNRSVLDDVLVGHVVQLLAADPKRLSQAVDAISDAVRPGLGDVVGRENAGRVIAAIFSTGGTLRGGLTVRNAIFRQVSFGDCRLTLPVFERCDLEDVDITQAQLEQPSFVDCAVRGLVVDLSGTRMNGASAELLDQIYGLFVIGAAEGIPTGQIFAPGDVAAVLAHLGAETATSAEVTAYSRPARGRIELLERFLLKMERRFHLSEDDLGRFHFTKLPAWSGVRKMLERHQLLVAELVQSSGPRKTLLRLNVPPELIRRGQDPADRGVPEAVHALWRDLVK